MPDRAIRRTGDPAEHSARSQLGEGTAMSEWKQEIGAITLYVPDLDLATEFYQNAFGLQPRRLDAATAMVKFSHVYVFLHSVAAAQVPVPEALAEAQQGAGQFAIIVDDVDAVCSELTARGVELITGPADRPWGMRTVTFADPGGHIWEIAQSLPEQAG
jgi:catechol 2,3-dioxygenase-like lactoylglutathione lyase family enzyme